MSPEVQLQRTAELLGAGAVVVIVPPPAAAVRGRLAERLDDIVERELGARGAPSPFLSEWSAMPDDAEARLADQLFRARTVGATGIAIALGTLAGIAQAGVLTPEDSAFLRVLERAAQAVPLVVMLDDGDASIGAYPAPVALARMMAGANEGAITTAAATAGACASTSDDHVESDEVVETAVDAPVAEVVVAEVVVAEVVVTERVGARRRATAGVPVSGPADYWRSWAIALGAARGPQPLAAFERLFTESYMPLANAIASGVEDPRALRAHDEFRDGFERSYADAFATFGASSRRPRLVMDAYDVASKQARMHNARTSHVLVVDAMRYDLGGLVRDRLAERAAGVASLLSESVLWSALPTTTFRQLETLARGMDALRAPAADEVSDSLRGRSAETVRRLRVGSRELYKLDVVPAMLGALGDPGAAPSAAHVVEELSGIASSVADALVRHIATLPPRTLLLVLGDHGFCIDKRGRITDGGASPEEVLVPCFAYLTADLH
ncbi:MAG TPA: hypothetical protein VLT33_36480 [Labilithrix sp.]|nr:hypothetical protein [Labilithrix sp.]